MASLHKRAQGISLLVMDVDGVLTDGGLYYGPDGEVMKRFDVKDGHGLVILRHLKIASAILTARSSKIVETRMRELGVAHIIQGARDKNAGLEQILAAAGVTREQVAYIGDDINDLPVLTQVGLSACPADARPEVREAVHYVCATPGGRGAVRELVEVILHAQGRWEEALEIHARHPDTARSADLKAAEAKPTK
ncbi:KdsC family phosphatase [Vulgatibacter sp.]|uniref:KdsC family phosphatase n=1 Tax=Vulgatibacter sp. TaxID=1971226 RepID=UPI00356A446C